MDMTPLVDITFLLLTFLMFTAQFKSEAEAAQSFTITRPNASQDTTKLPEKNLAEIKIALIKDPGTGALDTVMFFGLSNQKDIQAVMAQMAEIPDSMKTKALVPVDSALLSKFVAVTRSVNNKTIFAIDADKDVTFKFVSKTMDILRLRKQTSFNYVTDKRKVE